ncbi:MAG: molybdopterin-dependent oxidoreductase [Candidatus Hodarchaeota archaeon]
MSIIRVKRKQSLILAIIIPIAFSNYLINIIAVDINDEIPITPNDEFFTVAVDYFDIDPEDYRLVVTGEVHNPLNLSLDDIKAMPVTKEIVRLTCVGYIYSQQLTGVANWTGVKLSHILELAEINLDTAIDISFHTPDLSSDGYSTSLNPEEAFWDDVILAYEMNEVPLPKEHGYPIRLVCPRFYGYKWIKWLAYINVRDSEYIGFYPKVGYSDSPYVEVDLPIYYPVTDISQISSSSTISSSTTQTVSLFGLELFLTTLIVLIVLRLPKEKV